MHGGLRYLYNLDFKLVAEALRERGRLLTTIAPHLVEAQPFLWLLKTPVIERAYSAVGVGRGDLGYTIPAEIIFPKYYHKRGALAAARTGDDINPQRESSASQFYIVTGATVTDDELTRLEERLNKKLLPAEPIKYSESQRQAYKTFGGAPHLDGTYTVFGEVVEGFEVIDKIQNMETDENNRPKKDVVIKKMKVYKK